MAINYPKVSKAIAAFMLSTATFAGTAFAQDIESIPREDTFVIAGPSGGQTTFSSPGVANPFLLGADIRTGIKSMFEPLFYYNVFEDKEVPWLAESYEISGDAKTVTLKLRDGVKWSDGEAFNADDIVFTSNMLLENAAGSKELWSAVDFADATKSVEKISNLEVIFTLNDPMPRYARRFLMNYFGNGMFWVPEHIWSSVENKAEYKYYDPENGLPVTTSPWTLKLSSGTQIYIDRREDWWGVETGFSELPEIRRIVGVPFVNTDRGAQLIATGEADMTMGFPTAALLQSIIKQNPNITTFSGNKNPYGSLDWWVSSIYFNHMSENLPSDNVRKALGMSINRDILIAAAYSGASEASRTPFPAFTPLEPYIAAAETIAQEKGAAIFDLEESERLMTEEGFAKDGDGYWVKDGERISMVLEIHPAKRATGPILAQMFKKAGFDIQFNSSPETAKRLFSGQYDMGIFGHNGSIDSPLETLRLYHCDKAFPLESGVSSRAIARWCDEEYSAAVDEFATYGDGDPAAMASFKKAMEIWYDNTVEIPLNQWYHRIPMNTEYWTNYPSEDNPYIQPAFWYFSGQAGYLYHKLKKAD